MTASDGTASYRNADIQLRARRFFLRDRIPGQAGMTNAQRFLPDLGLYIRQSVHPRDLENMPTLLFIRRKIEALPCSFAIHPRLKDFKVPHYS
jgi:hypothetical protein